MTHAIRLTSDYARERAVAAILKAPDGYEVHLKPRKRSTEQNSLMWAVLTDISRAKPEGRCHTPEVWKELFMHAMGHELRFNMGLNGEPFPAGFRSSKLTVGQMSELIEFIYATVAKKGWHVDWTEPKEAAA